MKRLTIPLLFLIGMGFVAKAQKQINVGVIFDCPQSSSDFLLNNIKREAGVLLRSDYQLVFDDDNVLHSDCNIEAAEENLNRLLADPDIDLILGMDVLSSHTMAKNGPYSKPVIAGIIINAQVQEIPITNKGSSGVKNLAYVELPYSPMRDIEVYKDMIGFDKLALLIDETVFEGIPEINQFLDQGLTDLGITHEFVFNESEANQILNKLDDSFDAVYFFPSDILSDQEYQQLINGVNERQLKSFSILGRLDVDRGVLAGVAPSSNIDLISRRIALDMQRVLNGEDAEDINVKLAQKEELVINMATARQIAYSPQWETLAEAVLINEQRDDIERTINLFSAIAEGLEQNLNLEIVRKDVEIAQEDVNIANANLLPEVVANASHTLVDENTANVSNGQNPQHRGSAALQLSQVIYSEQVNANKRIQEALYQASEAALDAQSLDIVLEVATTYLNLMQSKTAENIQRENLDVTRQNLELARLSSSLGQTGPSDLLRWQGEIATAKSSLLNATAQRRLAELALNQILNRPIDELFNTEEIDLEDARLIINNEATDGYVSNPRQFYRYADFMVARGKANVPDLKQLDLNVRAQERSVLLNRRNKYAPTILLGGSYNQELYRGGSGTEIPELFGNPNDWNWNLQVGASLPIFQGGSRNALVQQSRVQLLQLNTQRTNTQRLLEQQIRSELENIRASYTNINLTRDAEEAVVRNFELVQDAYSQGAVTITQLLDAQNAAIGAQLNSANAVYIFLIDLINMERATGSYYMLMSEDEKASYSNELISFFNE